MSDLKVEICQIDNVEKHPNADRLSIATLKGWNCIIGLDDYAKGDLVVYCPPDSVIPDDLIEKYNLGYLKKNGRVGTVKLRQHISQGLILPVPDDGKHYRVGKDMAKELNITKYTPPPPKYQQGLQGKKATRKKRNPLFDKYTDIDNIKNYNRVFQEGDEVVITEKIHGSNFRASCLPRLKDSIFRWLISLFTDKYEFVYGSHNVQLTYKLRRKTYYGDDVYGKIAKRYMLAEIIPQDYILYGEIYGQGIQDLTYGLNGIDVVFFDAKYKGKYLDYVDFVKLCSSLGVPMVPELYIGKFGRGNDTIEKYTSGVSVLEGHTQMREGCVIKSLKETLHRRIGRTILKSVNEEYLLRKDGTEHK